MNCKYKVNIKDIQYNYKVKMEEIQSKYKFNIFCRGYDDSDIKGKIDDMYNAWPKVTGEGEEITLNDTVSATMPLGLKGNTYQDSTTGKNLLNLNDIQPANANTTVTLLPTGVNIKNITSSGYGAKIIINNLEENTDYYISYNFKDISNGRNAVIVFEGTTTTSRLKELTNVSGGTFNTGSNTTINIWFYAYFGGIAEVEYTDIQLEKGTSKTTWEKYTGGNPAPNPDYPQEVHVVSGDNEVEVSNGDNTQSTTYPINLPEGMFLGSIGDYKDTFFKAVEGNPVYDSLDSATKQTLDSNEWYLEKKIGKLELGSVSWTYASGVFKSVFSDYKKSGDILSNYFIKSVLHETRMPNHSIRNNTGNTYNIWVKYDEMEGSSSNFRSWCTQNNVYAYSVLSTPTYTKIEGTLASQLEALQKAESYSGQTNISQVNNDAPFIITASTLKDLSSLGTSTVSTLNTASVNRLGTPVFNQSIDPVNLELNSEDLELNSEDLELNNEEETIEETPEER